MLKTSCPAATTSCAHSWCIPCHVGFSLLCSSSLPDTFFWLLPTTKSCARYVSRLCFLSAYPDVLLFPITLICYFHSIKHAFSIPFHLPLFLFPFLSYSVSIFFSVSVPLSLLTFPLFYFHYSLPCFHLFQFLCFIPFHFLLFPFHQLLKNVTISQGGVLPNIHETLTRKVHPSKPRPKPHPKPVAVPPPPKTGEVLLTGVVLFVFWWGC